MRKKRKRKKQTGKVLKDPRDKLTEIAVYVVIILLAFFSIKTGYMMWNNTEGMELYKEDPLQKNEKEKQYEIK